MSFSAASKGWNGAASLEFPWARRPMGDTENKRRVRRLLSDQLDSYYEALVDAARRDVRERWEQIIGNPATTVFGNPTATAYTGLDDPYRNQFAFWRMYICISVGLLPMPFCNG